MSFDFVHIPKTAGTYILKLFNKPWRGHVPANSDSDVIMTVIRHPVAFYTSLYHFFRDPSKNINNYAKHIAQKEDINTFIRTMIDGKCLKRYCRDHQLSVNVAYDQFHIDQENEYGLLMNYLMFFFNCTSVSDTFSFLDERVDVLLYENLEQELEDFIKKYHLSVNATVRGVFINRTSKSSRSVIDKEVVKLINDRERAVIGKYYSLFSAYKGLYRNSSCYIIGSGPSLLQFEAPVGNDSIYIAANYSGIVPSIRDRIDYAFIENARNRIDLVEQVSPTAHYFMYESYPDFPYSYDLWRHSDLSELGTDAYYHNFAGPSTTAFHCLFFALYCGFKTIYLVGCDCSSGNIYPAQYQTYSCGCLVVGWKYIKTIVEQDYPGTEIVSVNPVGLEGVFRDVFT